MPDEQDPRFDRSRPLTAAEKKYLEAKTEQVYAEMGRDAAAARHEAAMAKIELAKERVDLEEIEIGMVKVREAELERKASDKFARILTFNTAVGEKAVDSAISTLTTWQRSAPPEQEFTLRICSPGGDVIAGMFLFDFITSLRRAGRVVNTEAFGYAASMGGILLQAGDKRSIGAEGYVLIHEISFGIAGKVGEVEDEMEFIRKISDRVLDIFARRAKEAGEAGTATQPLTKGQFKTRWNRKDWWLSSEECLKYGVVDEIL